MLTNGLDAGFFLAIIANLAVNIDHASALLLLPHVIAIINGYSTVEEVSLLIGNVLRAVDLRNIVHAVHKVLRTFDKENM